MTRTPHRIETERAEAETPVVEAPQVTDPRSITVADNPANRRYELTVDGQLAGWVVYRDEDGRRALVHTEVDPAYEGQGLGGRLARDVLDQVRERDETILPYCPFIASYVRKHREYLEVVDPGMRARFERPLGAPPSG